MKFRRRAAESLGVQQMIGRRAGFCSQKPDKFRDLARELRCDEDEAAFEEKVRKVAKAPPPKDDKPAD